MTVEYVLNNLAQLIGRTITVYGEIAAIPERDCVLVDKYDDLYTTNAIVVLDRGQIAGRLATSTADIVFGRPFAYYEKCIISGKLRQTEGAVELFDLSSCEVLLPNGKVVVPVVA
jgi:hypothetical protein